MLKLLSYTLIVLILNCLCTSSRIFGDDCKVHIENRYLELKQLIGSQTKFDWNNWSHLSSIFILGLLLCLLLLAYCFIKLKIWPSIKVPQTTLSASKPGVPPSVIDKPYIIHLKDLPHPTTPRAVAPGDD